MLKNKFNEIVQNEEQQQQVLLNRNTPSTRKKLIDYTHNDDNLNLEQIEEEEKEYIKFCSLTSYLPSHHVIPTLSSSSNSSLRNLYKEKVEHFVKVGEQN